MNRKPLLAGVVATVLLVASWFAITDSSSGGHAATRVMSQTRATAKAAARAAAKARGGGSKTARTGGVSKAATAGPLPFQLPAKSVLRASPHLVFAHYFTPYPISLDNKAAADDYYTKNYLAPAGESGKHAAYGGLLRDRPLPRAPLTGNWQLADMETEVQRASAAGLDGFTVDLLNITAGNTNLTRVQLLIQAAAAVDPTFKIVLMPDMSALAGVDSATLAKAVAALAKSPSVYHLSDGRLVVSPFMAEGHTAAWWSSWLSTMRSTYGIKVAFVPCFLNYSANASAFASISYGFSNWGNRNPAANAGLAANIAGAHSMGKIWMQPVSVQDERPDQGLYDEAANTKNLRTTWTAAIGGADWVQIPTWNDYSEGAQLSPSVNNGWTYLDLTSYYLTRYKTGAYPAITKDVIYLTSRVQPAAAKPSYAETDLMKLRAGSTAAQDRVEVLTMLTAAGTVKATIGGKVYNYTAPAGEYSTSFPLAAGKDTVSVTRGGVVTAALTSPWTATMTPAIQNEQYFGATSGR